MASRTFLACVLPLLVGVAHAQDERTVASPDGSVEFRVFTTVPEGAQLNSLAYQVRWRGKLLLDTSCLGLNIHFQEPLLGENVGLSSAREIRGAAYNGVVADYLQTSSTGRRIQVEIRVSNGGVAFRYLVPKQAPMLDLLIEDEATEFHFAYTGEDARPTQSALPYVERRPDGGWLGIFESGVEGLPAMSLIRSDSATMISHLPDTPKDPAVAFVGVTPWIGPWRMIALGADREHLVEEARVLELKNR